MNSLPVSSPVWDIPVIEMAAFVFNITQPEGTRLAQSTMSK